jgi:hypothetical protein
MVRGARPESRHHRKKGETRPDDQGYKFSNDSAVMNSPLGIALQLARWGAALPWRKIGSSTISTLVQPPITPLAIFLMDEDA